MNDPVLVILVGTALCGFLTYIAMTLTHISGQLAEIRHELERQRWQK